MATINVAPRGMQVVTSLIEVLPESEYLLASDPSWLRCLLAAYNLSFEVGQKTMLVILLLPLLILAPFIGMASAMWSFMASLCRTAAISIGRWLSDEMGYGEYIRTKATHIAWLRQKAHRSGATSVRLPPGGVRPSSRFPVLAEDEMLGANPMGGECIRPLVRAFNALFSGGFAAGTVLCAVLTIVFAPFVGMFVGGGAFLISLLRSFSRSDGRLLTDLMGVSDYLDQSVALMQEEMGVHQLHVTGDGAGAGAAAGGPHNGGGGGAGVSSTGIPIATAVTMRQGYGAAPGLVSAYGQPLVSGGGPETATVVSHGGVYAAMPPSAVTGYPVLGPGGQVVGYHHQATVVTAPSSATVSVCVDPTN